MSSETAEQTPAMPASPAGGRREWKVRRSFNSITLRYVHVHVASVGNCSPNITPPLLCVLTVRHWGPPHPQRGSEEGLERMPGGEPLVQRWDLVDQPLLNNFIILCQACHLRLGADWFYGHFPGVLRTSFVWQGLVGQGSFVNFFPLNGGVYILS